MTQQIKLAVGQTWIGGEDVKRTVRYIEKDYVCYLREEVSGETGLDVSSMETFIRLYTHKLTPKTVRKSQCVIAGEAVSRALFASEKEVREVYSDCANVQWPLVVNGVEQWVEVPSNDK